MKDIKWTIAAVLSIVGIVASIIYGYATLEHEVADNSEMRPDVKMNTEHRHRFEEKVINIERDVGLILDEVRK